MYTSPVLSFDRSKIRRFHFAAFERGKGSYQSCLTDFVLVTLNQTHNVPCSSVSKQLAVMYVKLKDIYVGSSLILALFCSTFILTFLCFSTFKCIYFINNL